MHILIDNALKHFYRLHESLIVCKHGHGNILLSLTLKEKTISNFYIYYIHIIEIPTNKGPNYYKLKTLKIGNRT